MKVVSVVGTRPQFIKAAPVCRALAEAGHEEFLVHTGQHYDYGMSKVFFEELQLREPNVNLGVGSGPHGRQTGQMLIRLEEVIQQQKPDWVLVYGDTDSTLAGALAACKLQFHLAHVEAGLRSFNREMPEEHNRVLTDHCSDLLFCPTRTAVENLAREDITQGVHQVGDTMLDAILLFAELARQRSTILDDLGLETKGYYLATVHRPYNTDIPQNMRSILTALAQIDEPVVFPAHPRTKQKVRELGAGSTASDARNPRFVEPVGYLDMLVLEQNARAVLTDSGGMQKEAYFLGVPCITLRPETEWVETVDAGWNVVVGADSARILTAVRHLSRKPKPRTEAFGDGHAAHRCVSVLSSALPLASFPSAFS